MGESRTELLAWLNDLLQFSYTKVEQCGSGAAHCQIIDSIYGDVQMTKVKFAAKHEWEYVANFKVLQTAFDKHKIDKMIPVERLVKCKFQDNLEFLQWMKKYWDNYFPGGLYDAVGRRGGAATAAPSITPKASSGPSRTMAKRAPAAPRAAGGTLTAGGTSAGSGRLSASGVHDVGTSAMVIELNKQIEDYKNTVDGLEKERDFYFGKLRDIEILVQQQLELTPDSQTLKEIQEILYSTEDGFEVPAEEGGEQYEEETF